MRFPTTCGALAALCAAAACSPTLDWRQFEPEGSGIVVSFPCRPDRHARSLRLVGEPVRMEMLVCKAGGATYALAFADMAAPSAVGPALAELRTLAASNIAAPAVAASAAQVPGMTPNAEASRIVMTGRLPDGGAVEEQAMFFSKGLRVYQASVVGQRIPAQAAETFLEAPRLAR